MTDGSIEGESYARTGAGSTDPRVAILGAGRVGRALAAELLVAGLAPVGLWNLEPVALPPVLAQLPLHVGEAPPASLLQQADVLVVAILDDAIAGFARRLSPAPGSVVLHTAGALAPDGLDGLPDGVHRGCYHPLQSFGDAPLDDSLPPYCVAIDGAPPALAAARRIAEATGHPAVQIPASGRAAYHAAAVLASGSLVALEAAACRAMGLAGVAEADRWTLLWPLVAGTLANLQGGRFGEALTGPVARGDAATVARNLDALAGDPEAARLYRTLGRASLTLASRAGLDPDRAAAVARALDDDQG